MSNTLYELHEQLHPLIQAKAEKFGLKIKLYDIEDIYPNGEIHHWAEGTLDDDITFLSEIDSVPAIQAPQIRQILLAFREVLGENPLYTQEKNKWLKEQKQYRGKIAYNSVCITFRELDYLLEGYGEPFYRLKKSQAETLCSKWLDGLEPMFNRELETVLSELLEVLKAL